MLIEYIGLAKKSCDTLYFDFFDAQPPEFWQRRIEKLPDRWAQIIDSNGQYITD